MRQDSTQVRSADPRPAPSRTGRTGCPISPGSGYRELPLIGTRGILVVPQWRALWGGRDLESPAWERDGHGEHSIEANVRELHGYLDIGGVWITAWS